MISKFRERVELPTTYVVRLCCNVCHQKWDDDEAGQAASAAHTHDELKYADEKVHHKTPVWLEQSSVSDLKQIFIHKSSGYTHVVWSKPGWYVYQEYEDRDDGTCVQFVHVDRGFDELREEVLEKARELKQLNALRKRGKPD